MASFTIELLMTYELYNQHGNTPVERAKSYVDDAINSWSEHSATINAATGSGISAPQQEVEGPFTTANEPCQLPSSYDHHWDDLGEWWLEYVQNCRSTAPDAQVLITNASYSGTVGKAYNNMAAVSEGGGLLPDLPPDNPGQGEGNEYRAINTVMHEIGHCLISANVDEHEVYNTYEDNTGDWGRTAMESGAEPAISQNECGATVHSATQEALGYSECAELKMG